MQKQNEAKKAAAAASARDAAGDKEESTRARDAAEGETSESTCATDAAAGEQDKEAKEPTKEKKRGADHEVSLSGEDDYEYTYTSYETETETDSTAEIARRIAKEDL